MTKLGLWWLAARPKTLTLALIPVLAGTSLAWRDTGLFQGSTAIATLLAALLIQIGTNLFNDAADSERGTDGFDRLGPPRAAARGWFSVAQIKTAAHLSFSGALLTGIYLVWIGGWPILTLGLLSILAGYAYTGGFVPIAYSPSGELFVFLFFGIAAVCGSYYLQTSTLAWHVLPVGGALGLLASAVLLVNNYRDLDSDVRSRKLTLTYYLGRKRSCYLYAMLVLTPFALPYVSDTGHGWLVLLTLPFALFLVRRFSRESIGSEYNQILANTAQLQLGYGLLLSLGLIL